MKKLIFILILCLNYLSAQDSTSYKNYFGIVYSPFGYDEVRRGYVYSSGIFNEEEIFIYKNETNMAFYSTLGIKLNRISYLLIDLGISQGSLSMEDGEVDAKWEEGLLLITPKIGVRVNIPRVDRVVPYFILNISKTFAIADINKISTSRDEEIEDIMEDMYSLWGIDIGFGSEIFLLKQLSLLLEAKYIYEKTSYKQENTEYNISKLMKVASFGFNIHF